MTSKPLPKFDTLMNPLLQALKRLDGSGTVEEIYAKVFEIAGIPDEQLEVLHKGKGYQTEVEYQLAWSRTYLKNYGLIENSSRGVWSLTPAGNKTDHVDEKEVLRSIRAQFSKTARKSEEEELDESEVISGWREQALKVLLNMPPAAFERLAQRLLRESGFTQVEVTGRSGDGGIDGKGIMRIGGLLSFHVIFQCKRWQSAITPTMVRDFRGAMVGRADKGLFITTGTFTKEAIKEATRDGAPPIDLVDSDQLINKLKELGPGVKTRRIETEEVTVDANWFSNL